VTSLHEGVTRDQVTQATGWPVRFAHRVDTIAPATEHELFVLRDLQRRTMIAHGMALGD
jgi:glutaconate CoA-transferase subunit B